MESNEELQSQVDRLLICYKLQSDIEENLKSQLISEKVLVKQLYRELNDKAYFQTYSIEQVREAFGAGMLYGIGGHKDLEQTHPDFDEWIKLLKP